LGEGGGRSADKLRFFRERFPYPVTGIPKRAIVNRRQIGRNRTPQLASGFAAG
jgi:hypothetical protein